MSSACLILILMRIEFIDGSIRTCSFSLRAMCIGFRMISDEVLRLVLWLVVDLGAWVGGRYFASISGMLCRSTTWLEKFSRHRAAVRLARTQFRYGRKVLDYKLFSIQV